MTFAQPIWFAALLALPLLFILKKKGYLGFSDNRLLTGSPKTLRLMSKLPLAFASLALILITVALAQPQIPGPPVNRTIPGRDIVLAVDISFSMSFPFKGELGQHQTPEELQFKVPITERRRNDKG